MISAKIEQAFIAANNLADDFQPSPESQKRLDDFAAGYRAAERELREALDEQRERADYWAGSSHYWQGEVKKSEAKMKARISELDDKLDNMTSQRDEALCLLAGRKANRLPGGLPPLPDGAVYLGRGGEFTNISAASCYVAWHPAVNSDEHWTYFHEPTISADFCYAAHVDSEIARLNGKGGDQ
jgi:hypothetical protein